MSLRSVFAAALLVAVLLCSAPARAEDYGDLTGQFIFTGEVPTPKKLTVTKDFACCGPHQSVIVDESLVVGPDKGLANVFIWLRKGDEVEGKIHESYLGDDLPKTVKLANEKCIFQPHAVALWAGHQALRVPNVDACAHNANINTLQNDPKNVLIPPGQSIDLKFEDGERLPIAVACTIHPWMQSWVKINDSPYIAITGKDGKFTIKNLPVGEYEFQVWHEKSGYLEANDWRRGRFDFDVKAGTNDLGVIKVTPSVLED